MRLHLFPCAALVVATCLVACSPGGSLPAIPETDTDGMAPSIAAQIETASQALAEDPRDPHHNGKLAMTLHAYGLYEPAAALYQRAHTLQPDRFRWAYLLGRTQLELGQDEAAIATLKRALALRGSYPAAELAIARVEGRQGNIESARARVDGVIALSPRLAEARAERAQLALDAGKPDEAIDAALYALGINSRYGRAHYLLSQAYARTGNERGAATHAALFERYRQLAPRSNDAVMREVNQLNESEQSLLQAALDYHAGGRADLAITAFNEMMETQPDSAGPHINLIAMHGQRGDFEAAEQHIEAALALNPESIELHDNIGVLRLRQGRRDEAIAHFEQAHELDPQYSRPLKNLGALYLANDDHQLGVDYLERALELEPTDIQTRYLLGKGLLDMRQAERAVEILKPLSRVPRPESALHLQTLGRAQIANGEIGDAIASLTEAQRQAQLRGLEGVSLEIANDLVRARAAL